MACTRKFIPLSHDQAKNVPFPIDCPVYVYDDVDDISQAFVISHGTVAKVLVSIDSGMKSSLYYKIRIELKNDGKRSTNVALFRGSQLRMRNGCPIVYEHYDELRKTIEYLQGIVLGTCNIPRKDGRLRYTNDTYWYSLQQVEEEGDKDTDEANVNNDFAEIYHGVSPMRLKFRQEDSISKVAEEIKCNHVNVHENRVDCNKVPDAMLQKVQLNDVIRADRHRDIETASPILIKTQLLTKGSKRKPEDESFTAESIKENKSRKSQANDSPSAVVDLTSDDGIVGEEGHRCQKITETKTPKGGESEVFLNGREQVTKRHTGSCSILSNPSQTTPEKKSDLANETQSKQSTLDHLRSHPSTSECSSGRPLILDSEKHPKVNMVSKESNQFLNGQDSNKGRKIPRKYQNILPKIEYPFHAALIFPVSCNHVALHLFGLNGVHDVDLMSRCNSFISLGGDSKYSDIRLYSSHQNNIEYCIKVVQQIVYGSIPEIDVRRVDARSSVKCFRRNKDGCMVQVQAYRYEYKR